MNIFLKSVLFVMLLTAISSIGSTYSYFSDVEYSESNTITMGTWYYQADYLQVDVSKTHLTGSGDQSKLYGIVVENNGFNGITIDKMQIGWNISMVDVNNIVLVKANGDSIFVGSATSGSLLNCDDFTLDEYSSSKLLLNFDGKIEGPFMIDFIMGDGSRKSVYFDVVK